MSSVKKRKVLVFGNPIVRQDSLPPRLIKGLSKRFPEIEFKEFDPNENLEDEGADLNIIDAAEGIDRVAVLTDIDAIDTGRLYSMHDFDLGYNLKLLKKLGRIRSVRIFCVPMRIAEAEALEQLIAAIRANLP